MTTISVLSKSYEVHFKSDIDMIGNAGAVRVDYGVVSINKDHSADEQADSLLHEVIHIVDRELKLDLEEDQVRRLATGLYTAGVRIPLFLKEEA